MVTGKMDMDETFNSRAGIVNSFNAAILSLVLSLFLAACGGGGTTDSNSPASASATSNGVTLAWDPPSGASNLSGYRIYIGTAPGKYLQPAGQGISVGNVTTYTLLGLSGGTRYYFAVTAFDTTGNESARSNETFKDVP